MDKSKKTYRIFLSAAEPSGDAHCAGLITALAQSRYNIEFVGVGGDEMARAGCKLLENTVSRAAMGYKALANVAHFYLLLRRITGFLQKNDIDLVIVCDSPAFNFHVAKAAKKIGIKTLFYVAPQLWAWAPWRIKKLQKYCDNLCCILPFEQDWFSRRGVETTFVGNPLLEKIKGRLTDNYKKYSDFNPQNVTIAIMPGSRKAEILSLWPAMQKVAVAVRHKFRGANFITVAADKEKIEILKSMQVLGFNCSYTAGSVGQAAGDADFSIVASGSATLQVAAAGCPMVIMYQSSKIIWHLLGRWLINTKYLSLVNILAEKELVPEFMPYFGSIDPIVDAIVTLLSDSGQLSEISSSLIKLVQPLQEKASEKTAKIAMDMLE